MFIGLGADSNVKQFNVVKQFKRRKVVNYLKLMVFSLLLVIAVRSINICFAHSCASTLLHKDQKTTLNQ